MESIINFFYTLFAPLFNDIKSIIVELACSLAKQITVALSEIVKLVKAELALV